MILVGYGIKLMNGNLKTKIIPRFQLQNINARINTHFIEMIIGPRQSGKTTLLLILINELICRKIEPESIFYINLDTVIETEQFENPLLFVRQIEDIKQRGKSLYLFGRSAKTENTRKIFKGNL